MTASHTSTALPPGSTLGVLGGGQLGKMFVHQAQKMGYKTAVLDPDPHSPAGLVSHHHIIQNFNDSDGLNKLAGLCDAVTTEFENVPAQSLEFLSEQLSVNPGAHCVSVAQDRIKEKQHFARCAVPLAPHVIIEQDSDLEEVQLLHLPGILKTARLGYDGKGQIRVKDRAELIQAWSDLKGFSGASTACVLEKLVPLDFECSIVLARNEQGDVVHLPIQRNIHRDGILALTRVHEGCIPDGLTTQIVQYANSIAKELEYVGVLCIEFFVLKNSNDPANPYYLMVNEIAPRPHNSGHYSVESCDISQFELQVRCLAHLPLIMPRQHSPALMLNLLGDLWFKERDDSSQDAACEPDWSSVLGVSGTNLSLYGKVEPRRARKMGHITITAPTISELYDRLHQTTHILDIAPFEDL